MVLLELDIWFWIFHVFFMFFFVFFMFFFAFFPVSFRFPKVDVEQCIWRGNFSLQLEVLSMEKLLSKKLSKFRLFFHKLQTRSNWPNELTSLFRRPRAQCNECNSSAENSHCQQAVAETAGSSAGSFGCTFATSCFRSFGIRPCRCGLCELASVAEGGCLFWASSFEWARECLRVCEWAARLFPATRWASSCWTRPLESAASNAQLDTVWRRSCSAGARRKAADFGVRLDC